MSRILPEAFEDGAYVVADSKLIIELAGSAGVLNIWRKKQKREDRAEEWAVHETERHARKTRQYPGAADELKATREPEKIWCCKSP